MLGLRVEGHGPAPFLPTNYRAVVIRTKCPVPSIAGARPTRVRAILDAAQAQIAERGFERVRLDAALQHAVRVTHDATEQVRVARVVLANYLRSDKVLARLVIRGMTDGESGAAYQAVRMLAPTFSALAGRVDGAAIRREIEFAVLCGSARPEWESLFAACPTSADPSGPARSSQTG